MTTVVQSNNGTIAQSAVTSLTLNVALGSTITSGNSVVVAFDYDITAGTAGINVTDDKGNTYTIDQNVYDAFSGMNNCIAHCFNVTNGAKTISVAGTSTLSSNIHLDAEVYEVSGIGAVDVSMSGTNAIGTALLASFSTAAANEFAVMTDSVSALVTYTQNNGWTQDYTNSFGPNYMFHNILASSGANSMSATSNASQHHAWVLVTFQSSSAPPTIPLLGQILM